LHRPPLLQVGAETEPAERLRWRMFIPSDGRPPGHSPADSSATSGARCGTGIRTRATAQRGPCRMASSRLAAHPRRKPCPPEGDNRGFRGNCARDVVPGGRKLTHASRARKISRFGRSMPPSVSFRRTHHPKAERGRRRRALPNCDLRAGASSCLGQGREVQARRTPPGPAMRMTPIVMPEYYDRPNKSAITGRLPSWNPPSASTPAGTRPPFFPDSPRVGGHGRMVFLAGPDRAWTGRENVAEGAWCPPFGAGP